MTSEELAYHCQLIVALKEAWPPECGPFLLMPLEVVADWYEEEGDLVTAGEFRKIAEELAIVEEDMTVRWRA